VSQRKRSVWRSARAALLLFSALTAPTAFAQAVTSVLTGNVVDASTKAPIADVVVTATSPALQGEQVVVTDATGLYRVPQLPPGTYTLRFEKESYRPYSRTAIEVVADRTLRLNVELLPETAGTETVTVIGTPPTIDIGSSTTGTSINSEFINSLAVSRPGALAGANRSFDTLATVAPQANADIYGVGISGATSPENLFLIDGLSVNNPAYGTLGTPLTSEFVDEVNVITGGYMPEFGRTTGGAISAVTKSGGNEFHGSVFGTFTPGGLAGAPGAVAAATPTIQAQTKLTNIGDVGATLGGYVIKDRLWFFAGFQYARQRYSYERTFYSTNATAKGAFTPIDNSLQRRFGDEKSINYIGKLTFLINPDHRISVSISGTPTTGGNDGAFSLRGASNNRAIRGPNFFTTGDFNSLYTKTKFDALDINGQLNSSFLDKKLLLDIRAGWHHQKDEQLPGDGSQLSDIDNVATLAGQPAVQTSSAAHNISDVDESVPASVRAACAQTSAFIPCPVTRYGLGGFGFQNSYKLDSIQAKGVLTYLFTGAGHHVVKGGIDAQWNQYDVTTFYTGGYLWRDGVELGVPGSHYPIRGYGYLTDVDTPSNAPAILGVVKSNIIGGFVQDSWSIVDKITLNLGLRYDAVTLQDDSGVTRMSLKDQWSPRVGVVYDPTQQGRSKIYANYGRYYENVPLDLANRSLSGEGQIGPMSDCNPALDGRIGCQNKARLDTTANLSNPFGPTRKYYTIGGAIPVSVDPNIKSPSNDEIVAGAEYEVLPNARAALAYTYRNMVRTIEDMSNTDGQTYFIGNPGEGIGDTFPKAKRTYHAVTASFTKSFADLWLAQISYTWSRLYGNLDGLFRGEDGQLDPNINSTFDLKSLLLNQEGVLNGDITHFIKAYVAKDWPINPAFSVTTGLSFNANSGTPINALGAHILYGNNQAFIVQRGSAGRLPWVTSLDANVGLNFRISKDMVLTARVEAFNLFNSQRPTIVSPTYTTGRVGAIVSANGDQIANGSIPSQYGGICSTAAASSCGTGNGSLPVPKVDPNSATGAAIRVGLPSSNGTGAVVSTLTQLNWGKPTSYQAVRTFRFSVRFTF
jgi:carboxypeptidase family protein/TonB-dependent receptor-like protein